MPRRYNEVWKRLAKNEEVVLVVPERGEKAVRAAIYNEKYMHNKAREATDLPGFGRINIEKEKLGDKRVRLKISVGYSGDNL